MYEGATITPVQAEPESYPEVPLDLDDLIVIFPAGSDVPPLYLVFSKPPVKPLEVDIYGNFAGRPRDGNHLDHMPAQGALATSLRAIYPDIPYGEIRKLMKKGGVLPYQLECIRGSVKPTEDVTPKKSNRRMPPTCVQQSIAISMPSRKDC